VSVVDQITYRARRVADGFDIAQGTASFRDQQKADRWWQRLDPWLRAGGPQGCAYLDYGTEAAFIRWQTTTVPGLDWRSALARVGQSAEFTGSYALELPEFDGAGSGFGAVTFQPGEPGPRRAEIEAQARSSEVIAALIPLLAHALYGELRVTMPWTEGKVPEAVMWGLISLLRMLGDARPVSFLTYATGPVRNGDTPGLLATFRTDPIAAATPNQGFLAIASDLVLRFAQDPEALRQDAVEHGVPDAPDHNSRISRLLSMLAQAAQPQTGGAQAAQPYGQPGNGNQRGTATVPDTHSGVSEHGGVPGHGSVPASAVTCPVCLTPIPDWDTRGFWEYHNDKDDYVEIRIPPDATAVQRTRYMLGAYVRCPSTEDDQTAVHHYLPARYAQFGAPVLLGFVGLTESGKSHLLASMVAEISRLSEHRIEVQALDPALHHQFVERAVKPLIARSEVLPGTPDDKSTTLADAFIVRHGGGPERVVALFDVSGGILAQAGTKREFLFVANGLFFVVDPEKIRTSRAGDDTFTNVLTIVRAREDRDAVSAVIVLNKADKIRFEEPASRWLRSEDLSVNPETFLRESADVYAYLERGAPGVLTEPYQVCRRATLHVASATGGSQEGEDKGSKYPRGVTPARVLRPMIAMLAMTGVLTGPQAEKIGV
jgi:hypothetical protein